MEVRCLNLILRGGSCIRRMEALKVYASCSGDVLGFHRVKKNRPDDYGSGIGFRVVIRGFGGSDVQL